MDQKNFSKPLSLAKVQVTDAFWKKEMELVRTEVIPYQWNALNDNVPGAAPSFCMRNYRRAGEVEKERKAKGDKFVQIKYPLDTFETLPKDGKMDGRFYGFLFQDTDFTKWVEAVAYSLTQHPDPDLEKVADAAIDIVCAAQQEDGYLDTYYIINGKDGIFTNLRDHHELYCMGHLIEGAVAYYEATGKDKLLHAAERFADYATDYFGPEEGKCKGYPGHEIAEMALVRLYEVTGEQKYLDLSRFFIDERGTKPYYFDKEHPETVKKGHENELRYSYHQAHLPVRQQDEAFGHAVRAVYLYSGMADIARITKDEELYQACVRLWNNVTKKKMYITGGIGATHLGEAFSFPYDLPNDTAYAETCASIGLMFWARRMLEIVPDAKYADIMERALYNGVLSGMALDGKSFFYVNPLEVLPEAGEFARRIYGGLPIQIGYCNGSNHRLNALEYHRNSEINIAVTNMVLLLGWLPDVTDAFTYDTSRVEAFFVPAGTVVEMYGTTLHYAPCNDGEEGFKCIVILPKGTNTEIDFALPKSGEDALMTAKNKWLIAHEEAGIRGVFNGLLGVNIEV